MLRHWHFNLELDEQSSLTIHQQLLQRYQTQIKQGLWAADSILPSTREVAKCLGINRKTVAKVYDELSAQGWIYTKAQSGTFVSGNSIALSIEPPNTTINRWQSAELTATPHHSITQFTQKLMVQLTRKAALQVHKVLPKNHNESGYLPLRECIAKSLVYEKGLSSIADQIICHHQSYILQVALLNTLKPFGIYVLVDESVSIETQNRIKDAGFELFVIKSHINEQERYLDNNEIEKYCINYPVSALWLCSANEELNMPRLAMTQYVSIAATLKQYNVHLVEDHLEQFPPVQTKVISHYLPEQSIFIGSLYGQTNNLYNLAYLSAPQPLNSVFKKAIAPYANSQQLLNMLTQTEFISSGAYKKLMNTWRKVAEDRGCKLQSLISNPYQQINAKHFYLQRDLIINIEEELTSIKHIKLSANFDFLEINFMAMSEAEFNMLSSTLLKLTEQ